ncbi:hypothetical protein LTR17_026120 [Elasticomyces elasticus]|nr:hypothetical protein LTR17_026120 [Elasticomyces elasticus]
MQAYYESFDDEGLAAGFRDLDDSANLDDLLSLVRSSISKNFVVDFNDSNAYTAFDLPAISVARLLDASLPDAYSARWINVWRPYSQQPLLSALAQHYDFSPRLLGLMCSDPRLRKSPATSSSRDHQSIRKHAWRSGSTVTASSDTERGSDELSDLGSAVSQDSLAGGNLYRIVDDIWHYTSVDLGRNYVCIGYNSLYGTKPAGVEFSDDVLPHCVRVWTWLVLCDDSTIITVNEDPFPFANGRLDELQERILQETRRNLINVFRSLSRVDETERVAQQPMTLLPIRTRLGDTPEETAHRGPDTPGLLFYYLFENFHNSYTLVTRKESRYGVELRDLRAQMMAAPKLHHIDRLESIGRELGVLKRHYQSHIRIIDRLLEPQTMTAASLQGSRIVDDESQGSLHTIRAVVTEKESLLGVSFSSAARVRFRRLQDWIDLYALCEVEEYLKQKDSLVAMNFNLIAMNQSVATERLTRVALLMTKATILFLPVSFMSGYFGINLGNEQPYTLKEYWICFAVIFACSWVTLVVFGVFSGSMQTIDLFIRLWSGYLYNRSLSFHAAYHLSHALILVSTPMHAAIQRQQVYAMQHM